MVATITPVGHGGRRVGWAASVTLHAAAAGASAALLGAVVAAAGSIAGAPWGAGGAVVVALVAGTYALRELLGVPVPLPERRRQVPEWWRTDFSPPVAAVLYGAGLGVGFLTYLRHGTLVAVGAAALVTGEPAVGALLMAPFGIARALAVAAVGRARTPDHVSGVVAGLEALGSGRWPHLVNGALLVGVAAFAVVAARGASVGALAPAASGVLALAFGWAATAKILRPGSWRRTLRTHQLGSLEGVAAVGIPLAEGTVAALVVAGRPSIAGALAVALLAAFSGATIRARRLHGPKVPCGCFGAERAVDYRVALARNAALAGAALLALGAPADPRIALRPPAGMELVPAALAAAGVALGVWAVVRSARWLGGTGG